MPDNRRTRPVPITPGFYTSLLIGLSLAAIAAAFVTANSFPDFESKSRGFSVIIVVFLVASLVIYHLNNRRNSPLEASAKARNREDLVNEKLQAIEEAGRYFGGSLNSSDVFRLIADKINEIVPFTTILLKIVDRSSGSLRVIQEQGRETERLHSGEARIESGASSRCLATGMVQIDRGILAGELSDLPAGDLCFRSTVAIPLVKSGEVFAIIQLFSDMKTAFDACPFNVFEAIGERAAELVFSSLSFEQSMTNALTDPVTDLPNERAFHLMLEKQLAESQRNRETRPLTVVAIDIKEFEKINQSYGHAAGDRVLGVVAGVIKGQLRQMDVVSRTDNDEFLVMLPTATESVAEDVIERIENGVRNSRMQEDDFGPEEPELNFGIASFGPDGESPEPLILAARVRKQQGKVSAPRQVLWFPRDFAS